MDRLEELDTRTDNAAMEGKVIDFHPDAVKLYQSLRTLLDKSNEFLASIAGRDSSVITPDIKKVVVIIHKLLSLYDKDNYVAPGSWAYDWLQRAKKLNESFQTSINQLKRSIQAAKSSELHVISAGYEFLNAAHQDDLFNFIALAETLSKYAQGAADVVKLKVKEILITVIDKLDELKLDGQAQSDNLFDAIGTINGLIQNKIDLYSDVPELQYASGELKTPLRATSYRELKITEDPLTFPNDCLKDRTKEDWANISFQRLQEINEEIKAEKQQLSSSPESQPSKPPQSQPSGWAGAAYNGIVNYVSSSTDKEQSGSETERSPRSTDKLDLIQNQIYVILTSALKVKKTALREFKHAVKAYNLTQLSLQTQEQEREKTLLEKISAWNSRRIADFLTPAATLIEVIKYLSNKFKDKRQSEKYVDKKAIAREKAMTVPEYKGEGPYYTSDEEETTDPKAELESFADQLPSKKPFIKPTYLRLLFPPLKPDLTQKDSDFEGHLKFQNFHKLKQGKLHPIDKAYNSPLSRFLFGHTSIDSWSKFIFPLYHILLFPKKAYERGEGAGLIPVIANLPLLLAVATGIIHEKITDAKDETTNIHAKRFLKFLELAWYFVRAPITVTAIAVNTLLVAALILAAAALILAVIVIGIGLAATTMLLSSPVFLINGWINTARETKRQLVGRDTPLKAPRPSAEDRDDVSLLAHDALADDNVRGP